MYDQGKGVTKDYKQTIKWYTLAAEQGHRSSQFNLGNMYRTGQGITQDYERAVKWYTLAADQGHRVAQLNLGLFTLLAKKLPETTSKQLSGTR